MEHYCFGGIENGLEEQDCYKRDELGDYLEYTRKADGQKNRHQRHERLAARTQSPHVHTGSQASGSDDHLVETPSPKGANRLRSRLGSKDNEFNGESEGLGAI